MIVLLMIHGWYDSTTRNACFVLGGNIHSYD